jgi:pyrimidine-specific ribonucleoside hydrolase
LDQVVVNTLKVLDIAGAADIPVAAGMRQPLLEAVQLPSVILGHDGMGDLGLATSTRQLAEAHAVELLRQLLSQAVAPVTLIALAPLTNIAVLLRMYPEVRSKIAGITIMGGTFIAPGNTSPLAEFNVRVDPERRLSSYKVVCRFGCIRWMFFVRFISIELRLPGSSPVRMG